MLSAPHSMLLTVEASRPAFMIVMGLFLLLVAWRLVQGRSGWAPRLILSGALLLAFGYAVVVPLYEAGRIPAFGPGGHHHGEPALALGWHVVKLFAMNAGWLLFGLGVALHARVFAPASATLAPVAQPVRPPEALSEHQAA
jgi:hypothetical protein